MKCGVYSVVSSTVWGNSFCVNQLREGEKKGYLFLAAFSHVPSLNLLFLPRFPPAAVCGNIAHHKVSFVRLLCGCPVKFYGFSCERGFGAQSRSNSIEILNRQRCGCDSSLAYFFPHHLNFTPVWLYLTVSNWQHVAISKATPQK